MWTPLTPVGRSGSQRTSPEASHLGLQRHRLGLAQLIPGRTWSPGTGSPSLALQTSPFHLVWCLCIQGAETQATFGGPGELREQCYWCVYMWVVKVTWQSPVSLLITWDGCFREGWQTWSGPNTVMDPRARQGISEDDLLSQPCVLDPEVLILIESSFRAPFSPCLKGFQASSHPSAYLTQPGALGETLKGSGILGVEFLPGLP